MVLLIHPSYTEIFPGTMPTLEETIGKISSKTLLIALSVLSQKIYLHKSDIDVHEDILREICLDISSLERDKIFNNYIKFKKNLIREGNQPIIFNNIAILNCIYKVFQNINNLPDTTKLDPETNSIYILKALLIANSLHDAQLEQIAEMDLNKRILITEASQYEFINNKDAFYQISLASEFFQFISQDPVLNEFLKEFLTKVKLNNYIDYIRHVFALYIQPLYNDKYRIVVENDDKDSVGEFFNSLAHDFSNTQPVLNSVKDDVDYKLLRNQPLLKTEENTYYIINFNFLIDKLYQGLIFNFYNSTSLKRRKDIFTDFSQFLSHLGTNFAEKRIFHKLIPGCFIPNRFTVIKSGDEEQEEYSDYYVRQSTRLFLFEFKNYIINAKVKHSFNFEEIKQEVFKKLVENEKSKPKGVSQLLNVIDKINQGGFSFDNFAPKFGKRLFIYPILVYSDDFFMIEGMQQIVSQFFKDKLNSEVVKRQNIKDVVLISLSDLIDIKYAVTKGHITFESLLNIYYEEAKKRRKKRFKTPEDVYRQQPRFRELIDSYLPEVDLEERIKNTIELLELNP